MPLARLFASFLLLFVLMASCGSDRRLPSDEVTWVPRSQWSTLPPDHSVLEQHPMGQIRFLSIHHTETPIPDSVSEEQRLRNIQHFHQNERDWGDIAYHYLIGPSGRIYEGRSESYAASSGTVYLQRKQWETAPQDESGRTLAPKPNGALPPGHTQGHLTISFLGSYSKELPTLSARAALVELVRLKFQEHDLDLDGILFHREIACLTDCPGQALYDWFRGPTRQREARGPGLELLSEELAK